MAINDNDRIAIEVGASARKRRLYAVACCRRIRPLLTDPRSRNAVELAERYAEGMASEEELLIAEEEAANAIVTAGIDHDSQWHANPVICAAYAACEAAAPDEALRDVVHYECDRRAAVAAQALGFQHGFRDLWLDIFEGYVSNTQIAPADRSETVLQMANTIYREGQFEVMPILADALEDCGCDNTAILEHCRCHSDHARGCWALDLLLDRE